jgi:hypothetical protein
MNGARHGEDGVVTCSKWLLAVGGNASVFLRNMDENKYAGRNVVGDAAWWLKLPPTSRDLEHF